MIKLTALNPISTPLNSVSLIEASAGTGKTHTIKSLYLRLLLQIGEQNFPQPLTVEQILVVTFTEAATQELKERIRTTINEAKKAFQHYLDTKDQTAISDEFLVQLIDEMPDEQTLKTAIYRLRLAEQNMDMAAIYTIHGFCRKMLTRYAFNSGIHFDLDLTADESELVQRFANEVWRENFYSVSLTAAKFIHQYLVSPNNVVQALKPYLSADTLKLEINQPHLLELSLPTFLSQYIEQEQQLIDNLKQQWLQHCDEIKAEFLAELAKNYKKGEKKRLKRTIFKSNLVPNWFNEIQLWANNGNGTEIANRLLTYFSQEALNTKYAEDGAEPMQHPIFALVDEISGKLNQTINHKVLLWHYLNLLKQKLFSYKQNHAEKSFDDLLRLLKDALVGKNGNELAQLIRYQYPFAMIDEFQDTDAQQYQIFSKIYIENAPPQCGFIMIGDPKQAIYKFRGADIFTYLTAADQVKEIFNLETNWRSIPDLVNGVNALFDFPQSPFLYDDIAFHPVRHARRSDEGFELNQQMQPAFNFYFAEKPTKLQLAKACAAGIQQSLKSAVENNAFIVQWDNSHQTLEHNPLLPKHFAVLVRNKNEAALIKNALQELGIASVYLSDQSNVFDSKEAQELALILKACLNPNNERNILNAIATALFAHSTAEIQRLKQNESEWEKWVDRFERYQRTWAMQGVLPMLHQLFLKEEIPAKILSQPNGERRVTDLLHLAELLQQASGLQEKETDLLRWFELQIQGKNRAEGQEIRLESEQDLVKIVTIHKSKGLQYEILWLPFLGNGIKAYNNAVNTYYSEQDRQTLWDIENQHSDDVLRELQAEEMRLLYVALTRAKCQLNITLPKTMSVTPKAQEIYWNPLDYALKQGDLSNPSDFISLVERFAQRVDFTVNQQSLDVLQADKNWQFPVEKPQLEAGIFTGNIEKNWQISSFTALKQMNERAGKVGKSAVENSAIFYDEAQDYDLIYVEKDEYAPVLNKEYEHYPAGRTPFDFPHGSQVGTALHRYFENCEFNQPIDEQAIAKLCQSLQLDESWLMPTKIWMFEILSTPLTFGLNLAKIDRTSCLKEMQFYLKLRKNFPLQQFNRLLQQHHPLYQTAWHFEQIQGMIRGFIDLVFRHDGKYYILDYKSNYLGGLPQHYEKSKLSRVVSQSGYDLQYLLYTVALHRYLKVRNPNYNYEQHFGGVIYAFIRGMNSKNSDFGVYFNKPKATLIEQLDQLF
ncbi:DNA helicase/exodeoxyribonuclease V beta subunit [Cricetibacter osteomyelitidis]|uniref:RecBCD enzyme subunit RecB n=1 Tax=Cricetibacter osteomyelitidis TaxID=1521931 RepID=A0A4R2SMJ4_9PAST|nr:exodeoxyribonuclease V subunit beta [Cricetibacter osteomyelitidis]TCP91247.1 DNA helicase/exodeoxyribonuclease V beta subunit [Cricetibacter osteomyelitidis]